MAKKKSADNESSANDPTQTQVTTQGEPSKEVAANVTASSAPPPSGMDYDPDSIRHLEGVEGIRMRPSMYIGNVGSSGLHHLISELVDNSIDEALAGYCKNITVRLHLDGSCSVADDGRGIPVGINKEKGISALQLAITEIHAGGKFDKNSYKVSGGLHGVGLTAVNALSVAFEAEVRRDGKRWVIECERGKVLKPCEPVGEAKGTGTKVTFMPDSTIFHETKFKVSIVEGRLRELAYLNPGIRISLVDEESNTTQEFYSEDGLKDFVKYLNRVEQVIHDEIVSVTGRREVPMGEDTGMVEVAVAFQYNTGFNTDNTLSYCNNIHTHEGGTHLIGFRNALTRTLNTYGKNNNIFKNPEKTPTGEDFREGLAAVVSVKVPDPQFGGQTKNRLGNPEVEGIVQQIFGEALNTFLEEHPKVAKKLIEKGLLAAEAREAAKKAREMARTRKGALTGSDLPGKLFDCIEKDARQCELFLVEGQSAGGTAVNGRDRNFQAILPLKGKILNVEKSRVDRVLGSDEIVNIIKAVGVGIGNDLDLDKRNYEKVVIMTDADVDGSHIRTLLLTFFYRQMHQLVMNGHIYIAQPPLYSVKTKNSLRYVQTEEEMRQEFLRIGLEANVLEVGKRKFEKDELEKLSTLMTTIDHSLQTLERRGIELREFFARADAQSKMLPTMLLRHQNTDHFFFQQADLDAYLAAHGLMETNDVVVPADGAEGQADGNGAQANGVPAQNGVAKTKESKEKLFQLFELHEVKAFNRAWPEYEKFGFTMEDLLPERIKPGQEPKPRFHLVHQDDASPLGTIREVPQSLIDYAKRRLEVRRYKGLGEMNDEELWNTTMDPTRRRLVRVKVEDAAKANEMFVVLMGEQVEQRRDFIEQHALEVRNFDYHA